MHNAQTYMVYLNEKNHSRTIFRGNGIIISEDTILTCTHIFFTGGGAAEVVGAHAVAGMVRKVQTDRGEENWIEAREVVIRSSYDRMKKSKATR